MDSEDDLSIIPPSSKHKKFNSFKLYAAHGRSIPTFGFKILTLDLGICRQFQFPFIIAKVYKDILCEDFLYKFKLRIDVQKRKLIDGVTDSLCVIFNYDFNKLNLFCEIHRFLNNNRDAVCRNNVLHMKA